MRLKTYSMTMGETVNMGNYNNAKYEVSGSIELTGDETEDELRKAVQELGGYLTARASVMRRKITGEPNGNS